MLRIGCFLSVREVSVHAHDVVLVPTVSADLAGAILICVGHQAMSWLSILFNLFQLRLGLWEMCRLLVWRFRHKPSELDSVYCS